MPLPASWASPAIFSSCSVTPSVASINITQTFALSIAFFAFKTEYSSIFSYILFFLLIPAVSIKVYLPYLLSNSESIASLVVPAISDTISLSSFNILFINDDFPAFGFPIIATLILSSSSLFSISSPKYMLH